MSVSPLSKSAFLARLDEVIASHSMLDHPFYRKWNDGRLSLETLQDYVRQYYAHVAAFPAYVSAVHSHCEEIPVRQMLLENLIEEEHGPENHPELWLRLCDGLRVDRSSVKNASLLPETRESVARLKLLTQRENFCEGLAALYSYESQIPEVARTKREGLKKHFGIDDPRAVSFFTVHETADVIHSQVERDILAEQCATAEEQNRVLSAAEEAAKALLHFLDGVDRRIACA